MRRLILRPRAPQDPGGRPLAPSVPSARHRNPLAPSPARRGTARPARRRSARQAAVPLAADDLPAAAATVPPRRLQQPSPIRGRRRRFVAPMHSIALGASSSLNRLAVGVRLAGGSESNQIHRDRLDLSCSHSSSLPPPFPAPRQSAHFMSVLGVQPDSGGERWSGAANVRLTITPSQTGSKGRPDPAREPPTW